MVDRNQAGSFAASPPYLCDVRSCFSLRLCVGFRPKSLHQLLGPLTQTGEQSIRTAAVQNGAEFGAPSCELAHRAIQVNVDHLPAGSRFVRQVAKWRNVSVRFDQPGAYDPIATAHFGCRLNVEARAGIAV